MPERFSPHRALSLVFLASAIVWCVFFLSSAQARGLSPALSPEQAQSLVESGAFLLDVRTPREYATGRFDHAVNIPIAELDERVAEIPAGRPVLIYCFKGVRARRAYTLLKRMRPDITSLHYIDGKPRFP